METGEIARQTSSAIKISIGDTMVLVSAVGKKDVKPGQDFFPLTINYQERTYAAGKIPGGFFKREGRPSESETLTCRLIDRPLRPLFPKDFRNEVQVIPTVMSLDPEYRQTSRQCLVPLQHWRVPVCLSWDQLVQRVLATLMVTTFLIQPVHRLLSRSSIWLLQVPKTQY